MGLSDIPAFSVDLVDHGRGRKWALAALKGEAGNVSRARSGNRNDLLNEVAFKIGRKIGGGYLTREEVEDALMQAASDCGYVQDDGEDAARSTIDSGISAGILEPQHPSDDDTSNRPTVHREADQRRENLERDDSAAPSFPPLAFLGTLDAAAIPPVSFVYGKFLARGYTSLTVASPKVGKSLLQLAEAVDMASGGAVFGRSFEPVRVLYYNAEDGLDTLKARVAALCAHFGIDLGDLAETLAIESGIEWPDFFLLGQNGSDVILNVAALEHLANCIRDLRLDAVLLDPLQDMSRASESNEAFRALGLGLRRLSSERACAVGLTHHLRKVAPGMVPSIDDARGGSALRGTCRFNRVLVSMSETEAEQAGVEDHRAFFRIAEIESNLAPPSSDVNKWYRKVAAEIANGENVGLVTPWAWPDAFSGITSDMAARVRDAAGSMVPEDRRENVQAAAWFGHVVARICDLAPHLSDDENTRKRKVARVKELLRTWTRTGVLEIGRYPDPKGNRDVPFYAPGPNDPRSME